MFLDRTMLTVTSITTLVAALLFAQVRVAQGAPLEKWWLPALLAVVGLAVGALAWMDERLEQPAADEAEVASLPEQVDAASEEAVAADDLTKIEGVGPKMSAALIAAGLTTFAKVAAASEDELRTAIEAAGMSLAPSISTWAEQAELAAKGDWDALAALQDELKGGRRQ